MCIPLVLSENNNCFESYFLNFLLQKLLSRIPNQKGLGCPFHGQFKKQSTKHMETIQTTEEEAKAAMLLPKHDQKTIPFFWTFCGEIS